MPNNQTKKLAHGSMMIAIFTVFILMAYYAPLIGFVAAAIAPLPIAWFAATYSRKASVAVALLATCITFFFGGFLIVLFALMFAAIGFTIGDAIRTKATKVYLFLTTGLALLAAFAIQYVISIQLFAVDFIQDSFELMRTSYEKTMELSEEMTGQALLTKEELAQTFDTLNIMIPATITIGAFLLAFILISINLPLLKRLKVDVPKFSAFHQMRLPKAILWYYLIVLVGTLFWQPATGSIGQVILLNVSLILWTLLILQGLSFIFFALHTYNVSRFVKVIVVIFAIPLYSIMIFVGILDLGFNIRGYLQNKQQK